MHAGHGDHAPITFGEPAEASEADRTIEVAADELRFDPASIEVEAGKVVTFVVTNVGNTEHEFVLGDEAYQRSHAGMSSMQHEGNGAVLPVGETGEVTWKFAEAGEILYACHVNDHYSAGMVGRIEVE